MGEVYEVDDLELKSRVALKTIAPDRASSPRQIARFRQEIALARRVSHSNVCRVFDLGHHKDSARGDVLFLTMELVSGQTLSAYLRQHGPLSREQALPIVRQMFTALSIAHQAGIVHRDLKPGNVMLLESASGLTVKITDFGLATSPELDETLSSSAPQVVGTPEYMAPEQFRGQCSVRTDVYGLGMTLYRMLCGKLPATSDEPFQGVDAETRKRIGPRWQSAIAKSLATRPEGRFASVEEFWTALSGESIDRGWRAALMGYRALSIGAALVLIIAVVTLLRIEAVSRLFRHLPEQKHIAVLPFANIGDDAANKAFAEGVAESLTSKLSQLERYQKSFWVVPSSDTRNVKSLDEAYRNLNVTLAVTGSVQHTQDGVDLTANLVDAANHRQIASRFMHVKSSNLDDMQQRVWEAVADMLDLQVSPEIRQELAAGGTTHPEAYKFYEQGVGYTERFDVGDTDRAIGLFKNALSTDPNYALAYSGLGNAYANEFILTKDPKWIEQATQNARRAVELNPRLLSAHITLGKVYQHTGQLDLAIAEYKQVLEEDPSMVEAEFQLAQVYEVKGKYPEAEAAYKVVIARRSGHWLGYSGLGSLYYSLGRFSEAAQQFKTMIDLAPDNALGYYDLGGVYIGSGRYEDAIAVLKKGLTIRPDTDGWTNLVAAYMYLGRYQEAADAAAKAVELNPHDHNLWRNLADSYHQIPGRQAEARQAYQKALEAAAAQLPVNPNDTQVLSSMALYYAHLGKAGEAKNYISRALELTPNNSYSLFTSALVYEIIGSREKAILSVRKAVNAGYSLDEVAQEPELQGLRSDPRYQRWFTTRSSRAPRSKS